MFKAKMPSLSLRPCRTRLAVSALTVLAAGCSFVPSYQRPDAPIPAQFPESAVGAVDSRPAADIAWQDFVQDARLRAIVARALDLSLIHI